MRKLGGRLGYSLTYTVSDGLVTSEPATMEVEITNAQVWGIITGLWNGTAWLPVTGSGTTLQTATRSLTISANGSYSATAPMAAVSGKLVNTVRLTSGTLSSDSTITAMRQMVRQMVRQMGPSTH